MRNIFPGSIIDAIGSIDNLIEKYQKIYSKCLAFIENSFCLFESPNEKKDDFGSICQFLNGYVFKSKEYYVNGEMKVITIKNIGSKGFDSTDCDKINMRSEFVPYLLSIGDLVLTMTGNIGRFGIVDEADCLLNQRVLKLWAPSMSYIVGYLSRHKEEIMQLGKGTAQKNLSFNELKGMPVFNSKHEIINFAKNDWAYELMVQAKTKINAAKAVKTHLLNKYFGTE